MKVLALDRVCEVLISLVEESSNSTVVEWTSCGANGLAQGGAQDHCRGSSVGYRAGAYWSGGEGRRQGRLGSREWGRGSEGIHDELVEKIES